MYTVIYSSLLKIQNQNLSIFKNKKFKIRFMTVISYLMENKQVQRGGVGIVSLWRQLPGISAVWLSLSGLRLRLRLRKRLLFTIKQWIWIWVRSGSVSFPIINHYPLPLSRYPDEGWWFTISYCIFPDFCECRVCFLVFIKGIFSPYNCVSSSFYMDIKSLHLPYNCVSISTFLSKWYNRILMSFSF